MIVTKEQNKFAVDDNFIECCTEGPWFNQTIFQILHGPIFEELFVTARQDRYYLMCDLHAHDKKNDKSTYSTNVGGGRPLTDDSTINPRVSIYVSINFIDAWLNALAINFSWRSCAYQEKIKEVFHKTHTEKPTPTLEDLKRNRQTFFTDIGG